jgi:hypothetical protein
VPTGQGKILGLVRLFLDCRLMCGVVGRCLRLGGLPFIGLART